MFGFYFFSKWGRSNKVLLIHLIMYSQSDQLNLKMHSKGNRKPVEGSLKGNNVFSSQLRLWTTADDIQGIWRLEGRKHMLPLFNQMKSESYQSFLFEIMQPYGVN